LNFLSWIKKELTMLLYIFIHNKKLFTCIIYIILDRKTIYCSVNIFLILIILDFSSLRLEYKIVKTTVNDTFFANHTVCKDTVNYIPILSTICVNFILTHVNIQTSFFENSYLIILKYYI